MLWCSTFQPSVVNGSLILSLWWWGRQLLGSHQYEQSSINREKLTWQWKTVSLKMYLLLIFHCHVSFQVSKFLLEKKHPPKFPFCILNVAEKTGGRLVFWANAVYSITIKGIPHSPPQKCIPANMVVKNITSPIRTTHPGRLTWNLKTMVWFRWFSFSMG